MPTKSGNPTAAEKRAAKALKAATGSDRNDATEASDGTENLVPSMKFLVTERVDANETVAFIAEALNMTPARVEAYIAWNGETPGDTATVGEPAKPAKPKVKARFWREEDVPMGVRLFGQSEDDAKTLIDLGVHGETTAAAVDAYEKTGGLVFATYISVSQRYVWVGK